MNIIDTIKLKIKDARDYDFLWLGRFLIIWGRLTKEPLEKRMVEIGWYDREMETELWCIYIEIFKKEQE